ncbi:MAG: hypothetical protein HY784_19045 [Chloroflexi bacterium]|nr:hypothetical protein [Chloroflexota bacterium]
MLTSEAGIATIALKRQFITDAAGHPVAVLLPIEEFALVEAILEQHAPSDDMTGLLDEMEEAARDPLFMADLRETMDAFAAVDGEWWEPAR